MRQGEAQILLLGSTGQLGRDLLAPLGAMGCLLCPQRHELDLSRPECVAPLVRSLNPALIVNAAGYTNVDAAESHEAQAQAINARSVAEIAAVAANALIPFIHLSTDYVFDGRANRPYRPSDATNPLNVYARSKLAGEDAIRNSGCEHLIVRTSWVYSLIGSGFLDTMLRLGATRIAVRVVDDQRGTPTWSRSLARGLAAMIRRAWDRRSGTLGGLSGTYHLTCTGETNWYRFACAIFKHAQMDVRVEPITTAEYPTPARRPAYSVLDCSVTTDRFGIQMPVWSEALQACLREIREPTPVPAGEKR